MHPFVALQGRDHALPARIAHRQRQHHVTTVKAAALGIGQTGLEILLMAAQYHGMLPLGRDLPAARAVLGGRQHIAARQRIPFEITQHPVLGLAAAARSEGIGVIDMQTVGNTIGSDGQHAVGRATGDLLAGLRQHPRTGRTGLHDGRPSDMPSAHLARQPRQSVETMTLRDRQTKYTVIEFARRNLSRATWAAKRMLWRCARLPCQRAKGVHQ